MTDWRPVIDTETDPDAPITSSLGKRFDNNCVALAEGASGAPKIQPAAIQYSEAGDVVCARMFYGTISTVAANYGTIGESDLPNSVAVTTITSGVIRVSFSHRTSSTGISYARVLRGSDVMAEWQTNSVSNVYRSVDFWTDYGERITVQHRTSGSGAYSYLTQPEIRGLKKLPVVA